VRTSVIIPVFNGEAYLEEALRSVLAQDVPAVSELEVIVVDDGSTDSTPDILAKFEGRIRVMRVANMGNVRARNAAIAEASGDLIAFCDADDVWAAGKLEIQQAAFADDAVVASCCSVMQISGEGKVLRKKGLRWSDESISRLLGEGVMPVPLSTWVFRRHLLLAGMRDDLPVGADLALAMRVAKLGAIAHVKTPLVKYRVHGRSITGSRLALQQKVRWFLLSPSVEEVTFERWCDVWEPTRAQIRSDRAAEHFRTAGERFASRQYVRGLSHLIGAASLAPVTFVRKVLA